MINVENLSPEARKQHDLHMSNNIEDSSSSPFPGRDASFPNNIFDAPPSSVSLLRLKPLGLGYREPTVKELMQPLPPDRLAFKGGIFNRFIHAAHRKRHHDQHHTVSLVDRISPTQSQQQQQNKKIKMGKMESEILQL